MGGLIVRGVDSTGEVGGVAPGSMSVADEPGGSYR